MNIVEDFHRDSQRVLDRLVDGELPPAERRELLAALDDEPGAWRSCALAFLEAQCWRWQLSRLAAEPLIATEARAAGGSRRTWKERRSAWTWSLALAASVLVAFGLGTRFASERLVRDGEIAQSTDRPAAAHQAAGSTEPWSPEDEQLAGAETPPADPDAQDAANLPPWETLTVAGNDGQQLQLRLLTDEQADPTTAWDGSSGVSARLLRELEAAGWEVSRQQRLVPVVLSDGRQIILPVEEVDLRYPEVAQF